MATASTQDAFMDLINYDMAHRNSLQHSTFQAPGSSHGAHRAQPPAMAGSSTVGSSDGRVRQAVREIDAGSRRSSASHQEDRANAKVSAAERRRVKAAQREQRKAPIHGDALPAMPSTLNSAPSQLGDDRYTSLPRRASAAPSSPVLKGDSASTGTLSSTPAPLKGSNAVLVDREMERLRDAGIKELRMRWRLWTGVFSLLILAMATYFMARYIVAWLHLSPADIPLSDAAHGSSHSIDSLERLLCLVNFSTAAASIACIFLVVAFLRATRRRTCGLTISWLSAIIATTLQLASAAANLALVALWHRQYGPGGPDASAAQGATRDVGQRCVGTWDFDLLWNASSYSPLSTDRADSCQGTSGGGGTVSVKAFMIAGGIRLGLLVLLCTLWLIALGRYNRTLEKSLQEIGGVEQSAEMHRPLEEEAKHGIVGGPSSLMPGAYADGEKTLTNEHIMQYADFVEERYIHEMAYADGGEGCETPQGSSPPNSPTWKQHRRLSSDRAPILPVTHEPPRLNRFGWQRGEPSMSAPAPAPTGYHSVPHAEQLADAEHHQGGHGEREPSSLLTKVWDSLWGTSAHPHTDLQRNGSKLGVSGWFSADTDGGHSGMASEAVSRATSMRQSHEVQRHDAERQAHQVHAEEPRSRQTSANSHQRTASQERRAGEGRHQAAARAMAEAGHSVKTGDDLPHMPEMQSLPTPSTIAMMQASRHQAANSTWGSDDSTDSANRSTLSADGSMRSHAPEYVRTLGKLVRKLSAIESVGSAERSERAENSQGHVSSRSSLLSPSITSSRGVGSGITGHAKRASWTANHGTRLESMSELADEVGVIDHSGARRHSAASQSHIPGEWSAGTAF